MKIYILIILSVIFVLYGIFIHLVGSGTSFWLIWEAMGLFFFLWAVLVHKGFFAEYKKLGVLFHAFMAIGVMVLAILCGMIGTKFTAKGHPDLDYVIVLGAQVRENGPSVVLRYRLDAAIDYLVENPSTICIVSGGQGNNEPFSEAEGMADYLQRNGIGQERILLEDKSTNTVENIRYSKALLDNLYSNVGIITNNFHLFRAIQIAKAQGLENICGITANSSILYLPNNVLRECCGILKDWLMHNL